MSAENMNRHQQLVRYNAIGVIMNLCLSAMKIITGSVIHAHAIVMDGVNSLSDMLSCSISIFSAKLTEREADKAHPFGYGRVEYLCSMAVTLIISFIAVQSIIESVQALVDPHEAPSYSALTVIIMCVSLFAKLGFGLLMIRKGKTLRSVSMKMAGVESMGDALVSVSILIAMLVYALWKVDIEHYLCIGISLLIIYSGLGMIRDCVRKLIGMRVKKEYKQRIINLLIAEDEVLNVCNLILHDYGENIYVGSVDIEIINTMSASDVSLLTRRLIRKAEKAGVWLTSIGICGTPVTDPRAVRIWDTVLDTVLKYKSIVRAHSFVADFEEKVISFYIVQDYNNKQRSEERQRFTEELEGLFPEMTVELYNGIDI